MKEVRDVMKIKQFDVVELKDKNKAIILEIRKRKKYYAEVIDNKGETIEKGQITLKQIKKVIYRKQNIGVIFSID